MKTLIASAVLAIAAVQPAAAHQRSAETYMVTIPAADLNLSSPAGAAALRGRLMRAADATCGTSYELARKQLISHCRAEFLHHANALTATASIEPARILASR